VSCLFVTIYSSAIIVPSVVVTCGRVATTYTPGTGTPEVGGVTSWEALQLLRGAHFVACDIVEVLPAYDPTQITALLAANVAYEMLTLLCLDPLRDNSSKRHRSA
jgi:Arginase family